MFESPDSTPAQTTTASTMIATPSSLQKSAAATLALSLKDKLSSPDSVWETPTRFFSRMERNRTQTQGKKRCKVFFIADGFKLNVLMEIKPNTPRHKTVTRPHEDPQDASHLPLLTGQFQPTIAMLVSKTFHLGLHSLQPLKSILVLTREDAFI